MRKLSHHRQHQSSSTRQNDYKKGDRDLSTGTHINECIILFFFPISSVLDLTCFTFSGVTGTALPGDGVPVTGTLSVFRIRYARCIQIPLLAPCLLDALPT